MINYDIHWNPVRIIQRFGRVDRIGSQNKCIQLVNYWPDITLDEYINLKERVENRMIIADVLVYDNSGLRSPYRLLAQFEAGKTVHVEADLPPWFGRLLRKSGR